MYDVCVVGHVTRDTINIKDIRKEMPGGVAYYFSAALRSLGSSVCVITKLAERDKSLLKNLTESGIEVFLKRSQQTMIFENTYQGSLDSRTQSAKHVAQPFSAEDIRGVSARLFHLGPLTSEDIPLEILRILSRTSRISLDVQGFLRRVRKGQIESIDWKDKDEGLTYINVLKADKAEAEILSGEKDIRKAAIKLSRYGIDEVVITLGSKGSLIHSKDQFYSIPAFSARRIADTTGCGDTYMAGYIYKRLRSCSIDEAGRFAAAMASLKLEEFGPFTKGVEDVKDFLDSSSAGRKFDSKLHPE